MFWAPEGLEVQGREQAWLKAVKLPQWEGERLRLQKPGFDSKSIFILGKLKKEKHKPPT